MAADAPRAILAGARKVQLLVLLGVLAISVLLLALRPAGVCACSPTFPNPAPSPVDGVVVRVDAAGLGDVRGFELLTTAGTSIAFTLGDLENATEFSPSHLAEHQATSMPIRVWYRAVDARLVVYRLEDAPA